MYRTSPVFRSLIHAAEHRAPAGQRLAFCGLFAF